jgi:hypothetical protein
MEASTDSTIVPNSRDPGFLEFLLSPNTKANGTCLQTSVTLAQPAGTYCGEARFSNAQHSSGVGDLTVRVKGVLKSWEHSGLAAGLDVRVPTGDEANFLGTGAIGIRPFLVWSYGGRLSPHANLGFQWNGESLLAGDFTSGTKERLPGQVLYSVGLEAGVTRRLTATVDLIGQTVINGARVHLVTALGPGLCDQVFSCSNPGPPVQETAVEGYKGTYATNNASLGLRFRPFGKFLISASAQLKLDNGGLRSKVIPLVSATYTIP